MDRDFKKKLFRNTLFSISGRLWLLAIALLLTPYILKNVGNKEYGVWVLVGVFVSYLGVLDLGFAPAFAKYVAEYNAREDKEGVSGVFSAGIIIHSVVALVVLTFVYPMIGLILKFFNLPPGLEAETRFLLGCGLFAFLIGNFTGVYVAVINGLQRMDISNGVMAFLSLCYAVGCVSVVELGFGISGLAVVNLVVQAIGVLVTGYVACRLYPGLRLSLRTVRSHFLTVLRYGGNIQISKIAVLINGQFDKLVINRFIDVSHVTFYEIGSRPPALARSLPVVLLDPLMPASSELLVRKGRAEIYDLYSHVSKYVSIVALPLFAAAMAASQPIIEAWVGQGYSLSVSVMRILCVGYLFNVLAAPVSELVQGMGRPDYQRNAEALNLLLNVALSVLLVSRYGFLGAPVGTTIAMSIASAYYLWSFHRLMERPLLPFLTGMLRPALYAAVAGLLGFAVSSILMSYVHGGRVAAVLILLVTVGILSASYLLLLVKGTYLDENDTAVLRRLAARPSGRLAVVATYIKKCYALRKS